MNKTTKRFVKVSALILSFAMLCMMLPSSNVIAADKPPVAPTTAQENVIKAAADFLEAMDMKDMADNVRKWLTDKKIEIDPDTKYNGSTNRKGEIDIKGSFVAPLPTDELAKFKRIADLAQLLIHEKTHAHQAPEGGALADGVKTGDWAASGDVMKECLGPEATEVDAYYKQIVAYLKWAKKIKAEVIPEGLSTADKAAKQALKDSKVEWLLQQVTKWAKILKNHNFEKANKFDDVDPIADKLKEIDDNTELTEDQKIDQKIALLNGLISKLFDEDSFYDRVRDIYAEKKGDTKTTVSTPITPGILVTLEMPTGFGLLTIDGLPEGILLDDSEELEIEVYDFLIPPEPDPGYSIISPVYLVEWNALSPVPFELSLTVENMGRDDLKIAAFAMTKTSVEGIWTMLDTTTIKEGGMSILSATSDAATMYAVVIPSPTYNDLPGDHWAYNSAERLVSKGVIDPEELLLPSMHVTREMFVMYLVKALGLELTDASLPFTDIDPSNPYYEYVSTAFHNDLTLGVDSNRFGMGEIISREQSITFLIRAIGMEDEALDLSENEMQFYLSVFVDLLTGNSSWAYPYLTQAVLTEIVEGYPDSTMRGKNLLTHAEVITLIDRIMIHIAYNGK